LAFVGNSLPDKELIFNDFISMTNNTVSSSRTFKCNISHIEKTQGQLDLGFLQLLNKVGQNLLLNGPFPAVSLVQAFVFRHLDYSSSIFAGLPRV